MILDVTERREGWAAMWRRRFGDIVRRVELNRDYDRQRDGPSRRSQAVY